MISLLLGFKRGWIWCHVFLRCLTHFQNSRRVIHKYLNQAWHPQHTLVREYDDVPGYLLSLSSLPTFSPAPHFSAFSVFQSYTVDWELFRESVSKNTWGLCFEKVFFIWSSTQCLSMSTRDLSVVRVGSFRFLWHIPYGSTHQTNWWQCEESCQDGRAADSLAAFISLLRHEPHSVCTYVSALLQSHRVTSAVWEPTETWHT